jgi:hypothetical protein
LAPAGCGKMLGPLGVISVRAERRSCRCGGVRRQCLRAKRCVKLKPTLRGSAESKAAGKTQLAADNTLAKALD